MKPILTILTLLIAFTAPAFEFTGKVVSVADGDTITVLYGKKTSKPEAKAAVKKSLTKEESAKVIEKRIRKAAKKPTGELTKADLEKVTAQSLTSRQLADVPKGLEKLTQLEYLDLNSNQLTDVKGLEKLTQLRKLYLYSNQLTSVKGLEKLDQLKYLYFFDNPALTKAQIDELKKALPKCIIGSNPTK